MVYFFVPNIIGAPFLVVPPIILLCYIRVILAAAAFYVAFDNPAYFFIFYALSELMDAIDGHAARYFNQSTKYGAVLDMVTDRCSTTALLVILSNFYPKFITLFIFLISLDITSHYAHLYVSLTKGETSHKNVNKNTNFFLRLYYGNRIVLFVLCAANEAIFLFPYVLHFDLPAVYGFDLRQIVTWTFYLVLPLGAAKQIMNLVQLINAFRELAEIDQIERDNSDKKRQGNDQETPKNAETEGKSITSRRNRRSLGATPSKK